MQVEGGEQIQTLEQHMAYFGAPAHTAIGAMIETPKGVLNVNEVSDALQPRAISEANLPLVFLLKSTLQSLDRHADSGVQRTADDGCDGHE
jgi:hypothetical protein